MASGRGFLPCRGVGHVLAAASAFICQLQVVVESHTSSVEMDRFLWLEESFMYPVLAFRVLRAFALFNCHLDMGPVLASCLTELWNVYTIICCFICFCKTMISLFLHVMPIANAKKHFTSRWLIILSSFSYFLKLKCFKIRKALQLQVCFVKQVMQ